jgi:hypothetical protein
MPAAVCATCALLQRRGLAQITEGVEDEIAEMRRVEQQVAEFAARRARELAEDSKESES